MIYLDTIRLMRNPDTAMGLWEKVCEYDENRGIVEFNNDHKIYKRYNQYHNENLVNGNIDGIKRILKRTNFGVK